MLSTDSCVDVGVLPALAQPKSKPWARRDKANPSTVYKGTPTDYSKDQADFDAGERNPTIAYIPLIILGVAGA